MSATLRCGGGCGSELVTTDPVNHRAAYMCPRCREAERERFIETVVRCPKCGGPHPFHDPACVVHPDLIQDHNEQEQR